MATDYQSLVNAVTKHQSAGMTNIAQMLRISLLIQIANQLAPAVATDYQSLISSANVSGYSAASMCSEATLLELALLQIIAQNAGSGGGGDGNVQFGNYSGSSPGNSPSQSTLAVDTSNHNIWSYDNGAWHLIV